MSDKLETIGEDYWTSDKTSGELLGVLRSLSKDDILSMMIRVRGNHPKAHSLFQDVESPSQQSLSIATVIRELGNAMFVVSKGFQGQPPFYNGLVEALLLIDQEDLVNDHFTRTQGRYKVPDRFKTKPMDPQQLETGEHWILKSDKISMKYGTVMLHMSRQLGPKDLINMRESLDMHYKSTHGCTSPFGGDGMEAVATVHMIFRCLKRISYIKPHNNPPIYDGLCKGLELIGGKTSLLNEYFETAKKAESTRPKIQLAGASIGSESANGKAATGTTDVVFAGTICAVAPLSAKEKTNFHADVVVYLCEALTDAQIGRLVTSLVLRDDLPGSMQNEKDINRILLALCGRGFISAGDYGALYTALMRNSMNAVPVAKGLRQKVDELFGLQQWKDA